MPTRSEARAAAVAFTLVLAAFWGSSAGAAGLPFASKTLTAFKTCSITAFTAVSTAVTDANARSGSPNGNFGTQASMNVTSNTSNNRRVYVRFDLTKCAPAIPSTATIKVATLGLYISNVPTSCRTQDVFKVPSTWSETTLTWNNQPFGTAINNPASGTRTALITTGSSPCGYTAANQYVLWTVTPDVQSWVSGSSTNFGWMVRDDVENAASGGLSTYSTREAAAVAEGPQVVITYVI